MSYPTIFRKRTIEYRKSGHTLKETSKAFKVSISAIEEWEKKLKERGNLENKALNRPHKKIAPEKLRAYVEEHPDAYQGSARVEEKTYFLVKEKRKKIHKNCALQRTFLNLKFYNLFNAFGLYL